MPEKTTAIQAVLRGEQLSQPPAVAAAYAASVRSLVSVIAAFNTEIATMEDQVKSCFGQTRDAEIYLSQPGLAQILAARALGEFGDDEPPTAGNASPASTGSISASLIYTLKNRVQYQRIK